MTVNSLEFYAKPHFGPTENCLKRRKQSVRANLEEENAVLMSKIRGGCGETLDIEWPK